MKKKAYGRRPQEAETVIREAIIQLFSLQIAAGLSKKDLHSFALRCVESAVGQAVLTVSEKDQTDVHHIGSILRVWHRETAYLDRNGFPKPLSMSGKAGLRSLAKRHCPSERVDSLLRTLMRTGLIGQSSNGRWTPKSNHAVLPCVTEETYRHIADGVARFVQTVTRNVSVSDKKHALFERSAKVRKFPVSDTQEFCQFVRQQASVFLGAVDDWMEARAEAHAKSRTRKCNAGVFTFAFLDDAYLP